MPLAGRAALWSYQQGYGSSSHLEGAESVGDADAAWRRDRAEHPRFECRAGTCQTSGPRRRRCPAGCPARPRSCWCRRPIERFCLRSVTVVSRIRSRVAVGREPCGTRPRRSGQHWSVQAAVTTPPNATPS